MSEYTKEQERKGLKRGAMEAALMMCEDKSTEYQIQFIQDIARATFDEVIEFLKERVDE